MPQPRERVPVSLDPEDVAFIARSAAREALKAHRATPPGFFFVWSCVWRVFLALLLLGPVLALIFGVAAFIAVTLLGWKESPVQLRP